MKKSICFIVCSFIAFLMLTGCARQQVHYDGYFQFGSADWETETAAERAAVKPPASPSAAPPGTATAPRKEVPAHYSLSTAPNVILIPWSRQSPVTARSRSHTVRKGDTLFSLARQFYGDPEKWRLIYNANRNVIGDPDNVAAGVKLQIP